VVISILALLLAILTPSLQSAREMAKQVACAAQMKQWSLAVASYSTANDNFIPPYANTCNSSAGAVNPKTYWYFRLVPYMNIFVDIANVTTTSWSKWGFFKMRRCPAGKGVWNPKASWVGVYYDKHNPQYAPFIFPNSSEKGPLEEKSSPVKTTHIKSPSEYLMLMDVKRDNVHNPFYCPWDFDYDGDGINDSYTPLVSSGREYNFAQPKIHRGGSNVAIFDGRVEWIHYKELWEFGSDGFPKHEYWYDRYRP